MAAGISDTLARSGNLRGILWMTLSGAAFSSNYALIRQLAGDIYTVFAEVPDAWVWAGAVAIVAAGTLLARTVARSERPARCVDPPPSR